MFTINLRRRGGRQIVGINIPQLEADFDKLMRQAARIFIREAIKNIHIDTGMTIASLIPLARQVGAIEMLAFAGGDPSKSGRAWRYDGSRGVPTDEKKSPATGESWGEESFVFESSKRGISIYIRIKYDVFQHYLMDVGFRGRAGLHSILKGTAAAMEFIETEGPRRIKDFKRILMYG